MLYLDTAALVKLVRPEPESAALRAWLDDRGEEPRVSSVISEVELARAVRRTAPDLLDTVPFVLGRLYRYGLDEAVRATAASFTSTSLRSLDAIHLATAAALGAGLSAFVTYDRRLLGEVHELGLPAATPA